MTGIGTITAAEVFSEQVELKGRTTDPANTEPGEYWVRVDQTSSNPQVVAELRRQNTSGVSKIPLFDASEEANLGSKMVRGPSVVLDDGTVGFVAMASDSRAQFGSPRVVTAAGTEYLSHNSLTLRTIPDTAVIDFNAETFSTGDSEWIDELQSIVMSMVGDAQSATLPDGTPSVDADGNDDAGLFTMPSELDGSGFHQSTIEFSIQTTSTTSERSVFGITSNPDGNAFAWVQINRDEQFNTADGKFELFIEDGSGNRLTAAPDTWSSLNDGSRHDITISINDLPNNNLSLIIDGSEEQLALGTAQGPTISTWDGDFGCFADNDGTGTLSRFADIELGRLRMHDSSLSSQTIN